MSRHPIHTLDPEQPEGVARRWKNVEGKANRFGGPAVEWANGSKMWCWKGRALYSEYDSGFQGMVCIQYKGKQGRIWPDNHMKAWFWPPGYSKPERERRR
jgi:hypothetical protein